MVTAHTSNTRKKSSLEYSCSRNSYTTTLYSRELSRSHNVSHDHNMEYRNKSGRRCTSPVVAHCGLRAGAARTHVDTTHALRTHEHTVHRRRTSVVALLPASLPGSCSILRCTTLRYRARPNLSAQTRTPIYGRCADLVSRSSVRGTTARPNCEPRLRFHSFKKQKRQRSSRCARGLTTRAAQHASSGARSQSSPAMRRATS